MLLVGCKPIESNVVLDKTCSPPCWQNIEPGKTNRQEALSILNSVSEINQKTIKIKTNVYPNDGYDWDFEPGHGDMWGRVFFEDNIVLAINFFPDNNSLPLQLAIDVLGTPENIMAVHIHEETQYLIIYFLWPSKGIVLESILHKFQSGDTLKIDSDTQIDAFWYTESQIFSQMMTSMYIANLDPELLKEGPHPWTGYGDITEIIVENITH